MMIETLSAHALLGRPPLAGRRPGEAALPILESAVAKLAPGTTVLLDLAGTELLTASYFSAGILPLWFAPPVLKQDLFPVLCNPTEFTVDEIREALQGTTTPMVLLFGQASRIERWEPLNLDGPSEQTLSRVTELGTCTAADLSQRERGIRATAWSNRLAALHQVRILRRWKKGRQLVYAPCWRH